ncbi:MAG: hypothetical protein ACLVK4_01860 [Alistipes shahii]|uniref:hypothetical protein n=1 Tax=Alistipes shahii TaxID=328814 RepID=UPI00399C6BD2
MTAVREIRTGDGWWFLNTGVPHYVEFVDDLAATDVIGRGRIIRRDTARFPQGTNVNFVQVTGDGTIRVRTYERGVENETSPAERSHSDRHRRQFRLSSPGPSAMRFRSPEENLRYGFRMNREHRPTRTSD